MKTRLWIVNSFFSLTAFLLLVLIGIGPAAAEPESAEDEDTYSIELIKTAEPEPEPEPEPEQGADEGSKPESGDETDPEPEILEVAGKRVLTENHTVRKGEWIWQIFRERNLLEKRNLAELLAILKKLNPSLTDLDKVHPGQHILVPLTLSPAEGTGPAIPLKRPESVPVALEDLSDLDLEQYTVRRGDSLVKIIDQRYDSPSAEFYEKYLDAVRRLNPSLRDPDVILPGQKIRLPVFSPELVRRPIEPTRESFPVPEEDMPELDLEPPPESTLQMRAVEETPNPLRDRLGRLFRLLGEEWIQRGQHFIPLREKGEVNLRADAYPMIDLSNGRKVIVDFHHGLPGKMATLIEETWEHYRIVHLEDGDDLASALDRILPECDLGTLHGRGESVHVGGEIPVRLTADWILQRSGTGTQQNDTVMITILDERTPATPGPVRDYLARRGVRVVDYPPRQDSDSPLPPAQSVLDAGPDLQSLVETLLDLHGLDFFRNVEIPVYEKAGSDFNLFVKADYLFEKDGKKHLLDLTGVGSELMPLMRERDLSYLSLAGQKDPLEVVRRMLGFLGVDYQPSPIDVMATERDGYQNIRFRIQGISFEDRAGRRLLATPLRLPDDLLRLLARDEYRVLGLSAL
ncbi:MAG: LysM peptidoglycan-binding domain-containing protein [Desulfobacteraceae bacterium]